MIEPISNGNGQSRRITESEEATVWDLRERIHELEARTAEMAERDHIRELEVVALRHDVLLQREYARSLEESTARRQEEVDWLRHHADQTERDLHDERLRTEELRSANAHLAGANAHLAGANAHLAGELAAERQRLSYRIVRRLLLTRAGVPGLRVARMMTRVVRRS